LAHVVPEAPFKTADAEELYAVSSWASGYFEVGSDGDMQVLLRGAETSGVSLPAIVEGLKAEGRTLPVILRFPQIIEDRLDRINQSFQASIREAGYKARYQGVYPIKVNQRRVVVETIAEYGARYATGLEAGSKAELALILVQDTHPDALICCNGFKDDDFIRLALWGRKLGKNVVITLEKPSELERVLRVSAEMGVEPAVGIRFKLHAKGAGAWEASGGDEAKFGLTATELIHAVGRLRLLGKLDALKMIHCHVGSQLTDVRRIKVAVREAAQVYVDVVKMGADVRYLNVGGGLGVDYDGSKTNFYASANYGISEYADTVVYTIKETCDDGDAPHPVIVTESGRALTAHHALIVLPVIDAIGPTRATYELPPLEGEVHAVVRDMQELARDVNLKNYREVFNEAVSNKDTMHSLFDLGYITCSSGRTSSSSTTARCCASPRSSSSSTTCPRSSRRCPSGWPTSTSSTSASSRGCPTTGRSSSSSRSCRCTACRRSPTARRRSSTSAATATARSPSSSTCATCAPRYRCTTSCQGGRTTSVPSSPAPTRTSWPTTTTSSAA
jgi:arginine decarboxylase